MLKISDMANLANTTRRTLIFYDEEGIFKPDKRTEAGYRYYNYDQLYDLMFILGLRSLDIPLEEIKKIETQSANVPEFQLIDAEAKIDKKINELAKIKKVLCKKIEDQSTTDESALYQPEIKQRPEIGFWCSRQSISCTKEEVAQLFSEFYKQLGSLAVMDTTKSGFLTKLSVENPDGYADASFRIIKQTIDDQQDVLIPIIKKSGGDYVTVLVENNLAGISKGLSRLKAFCHNHHLKTNNHLWQINTGDTLIETGSSKYGWLEFAVLNETH